MAQTTQTLESEPMVTNRIKLPFYCLGPAPFPINLDHLDFEMFGSAHVQKGSMRLTDAAQSQRGAIWSKRPLSKISSLQVDLRFQVGGSPNLEHFGDGFAFWIIKERGTVGEVAVGGPDSFTGLGVFFDTFKNDNFRSKKHPWVYAKSSKDGTELIDYKKLNDVNTVGCHAPFRDADPKVLATTVARITILDGILSVVLRPKGSVDWIQCFEIPGIKLPDSAYIGVSAMTGGLIDNHHFLQLITYSNIDIQPFSYAHSYKITQMPDMWKQMKESGKIAREFADWEETDSFSDDLHWTVSGKVRSHLNDDYDDEYNEDNSEENQDSAYGGDNSDPYRAYDEEDDNEDGDGDDEDEEDVYSGSSSKRITRPKSKDLDPEKAKMSHDLEQVLQRSAVHDVLRQQHQKNADMMESMHVQMQHSMQDVTDQLHRAAREIRVKEHELSERVIALSIKMKILVINPFEEAVVREGGGWFWPFMLFVSLMAGTGFFGYTRYRKFMKQHVL
jgi:mannose-binding lectin 2